MQREKNLLGKRAKHPTLTATPSGHLDAKKALGKRDVAERTKKKDRKKREKAKEIQRKNGECLPWVLPEKGKGT